MLNRWNLGLVAMAVAALVGPVRAETRVQGSGATFPAPLYAKWVQAYNAAHPGVKVDYQAIGSGGGIKGITDKTVAFAGSDAPMSKDQEKAAKEPVAHLPMVAGPVVLIYNLPEVKGEIKLDGAAVADIFLGKLTRWDDARIKALNEGVNLPSKPITVVHRSDGSGTSYIFTDYLSKVSPEWLSKAGKGTAVEWPLGQAGKGNDGVSAAVQKTAGGIGYVESAYAMKQKLTYATQINKEGKAVKASVETVQAAIDAMATSFPEDFKVSITDAPGANSYPIAGFTYILLREDLSYVNDKSVAENAVSYIKWCATEGQGMAVELGYAKLPAEAQQKVVAKLKTIKFGGEAVAK